jgi:hypothetical protein
MRLIVGPLPAAVYWRRRAVVLVGLAMVVLIVSYACGGPDTVEGAGPTPTTASTQPSATQSVLHPVIATTTASPKQSDFVLPAPVTTGPCTDAEMDLTASAASTEVLSGHSLDVTIQIQNLSHRTCSRDIGADMQELRLEDATTTIWSTDDCDPNSGHDVRSFAPGRKISFTLTWHGRRSRTGAGAITCSASAPAPEPAVYQLVARLDQKLSSPFALRILA